MDSSRQVRMTRTAISPRLAIKTFVSTTAQSGRGSPAEAGWVTVILDEPTRRMAAATTRFRDIRELAEVDSTNRYLLDLARSGAPEGVVVVADFQSAGRGRLGRSWEAPPGGGLLVSILLRPPWAAVAPDRRWLVTAAVALAAADACRQVAGVAPDIK